MSTCLSGNSTLLREPTYRVSACLVRRVLMGTRRGSPRLSRCGALGRAVVTAPAPATFVSAPRISPRLGWGTSSILSHIVVTAPAPTTPVPASRISSFRSSVGLHGPADDGEAVVVVMSLR